MVDVKLLLIYNSKYIQIQCRGYNDSCIKIVVTAVRIMKKSTNFGNNYRFYCIKLQDC